MILRGALKYIQRQYVLSEELLTGEKYVIEVYSLAIKVTDRNEYMSCQQ